MLCNDTFLDIDLQSEWELIRSEDYIWERNFYLFIIRAQGVA